MSDYSISIVPKHSNYQNKESKAKEILEWLISEDIVKPTISDCVLGSNMGYSISAGAKMVTNDPLDLPFDLITNGLEIITERNVFHTGENYVDELICPSCKDDIAFEDWEFDSWIKENTDNMICPLCKSESGIHSYIFRPDWGFSNLGFTFWNWPTFTDKFIEVFKLKIGCDVSIVYQHI